MFWLIVSFKTSIGLKITLHQTSSYWCNFHIDPIKGTLSWAARERAFDSEFENVRRRFQSPRYRHQVANTQWMYLGQWGCLVHLDHQIIIFLRMYIHLAFYRCVKRRILCRFVAEKHAVFHSSFRRIATRSIYLLASLMYWLLQYCSKVSYPPLRKTRLVFLDGRVERNETRLVSREFTGSTNTSHSSVFETGFVYLDVCIVSYRVAR